jgi:hypothetical protein
MENLVPEDLSHTEGRDRVLKPDRNTVDLQSGRRGKGEAGEGGMVWREGERKHGGEG